MGASHVCHHSNPLLAMRLISIYIYVQTPADLKGVTPVERVERYLLTGGSICQSFIALNERLVVEKL